MDEITLRTVDTFTREMEILLQRNNLELSRERRVKPSVVTGTVLLTNSIDYQIQLTIKGGFYSNVTQEADY